MTTYTVTYSVLWRNYEMRSEAIASGRQAAGGARVALLVDGLFALHYRIQPNF